MKRKISESHSPSTVASSKRSRSNALSSTTILRPRPGNPIAKSNANFSSPESKPKQATSQSVSSSASNRDTSGVIAFEQGPVTSVNMGSANGRRNMSDTYNESTETFPRFSSSRIYIHLSNVEQVDFQLHGAVLARNSLWFDKELGPNRAQSVYHFILEQAQDKGFPVLVRKTFVPLAEQSEAVSGVPKMLESLVVSVPLKPAAAPSIKADTTSNDSRTMTNNDLVSPDTTDAEQSTSKSPHAAQSTSGSITTIKLENLHQDPVPIPRDIPSKADLCKQEVHTQFVTAHKNLLTMFYKAPNLSTKDIDCALGECEKIVILAKYYDCLPTVRPYLGNILSQFRRTLYLSITKDPPRWLKLATSLESNSIFSEAMTHCAGCYPYSPWETPFSTLTSNVLELVRSKSEWLRGLRTNINLELLINSLSEVTGGPIVSLAKSPGAWLVVQIFRDWFSNQLRELRDTRKLYHSALYRLMAQGGDAYLASAEVGKQLIEKVAVNEMFIDDEDWEAMETDLEAMKMFAKEAVERLMVNQLMIDPVAEKIPYLTCVEVGADDFPWN